MTMVASASPPPHIELTEKEKEILELLLKVIKHFHRPTHIRVAGGWVRDKLLGRDCDDIDIALDDMSGQKFCEKVNEYLSVIGKKELHYDVIDRKPDQSKHLETAKMHFDKDVWIDFVNLREEDYCENSRIPTTRYGTAEKDAYRRDLTINSLFYNINTSSIEDFTERGIADLKSGKIVTPLPPKHTFLDDPLRVLRAIRFGASLGFMLDEELKKAAADEDVRAAFANKISKERIGREIDLMMSNNQPVQAMTYIADLELFWTVFSLPYGVPIHEGCDRQCVAYLNSTWGLLNLIGCSSFTDDQMRLCLYAAFFLPFREDVYREKEGKEIPVVDHIFRNSLKLVPDALKVIRLHAATKKFSALIPLLVSKEDNIEVPILSELRVRTGLLLREIKEFWRAALLLSMLLHPVDIVSSTSFSNEYVELDKRSGLFRGIENAVRTLGMDKVWEMKSLVYGNEIMNHLQIKKGPAVGEWLQKSLEWQLKHPSGTVEECLDWMKQLSQKGHTCRIWDHGQDEDSLISTQQGPKHKRLKSFLC